MKANYIPIAMRCTQEQFESIKDMVPFKIKSLQSFEWCTYLINNFSGKKIISNVGLTNCFDYGREVIEVFDGKHFLECCGLTVLEDVSEEKIWNGTEIQWRYVEDKHWNDSGRGLEYRLKPKEVNPIQCDVDALLAKAESLGIKLKVEFE
jgi:hypothetical protein